MTLTNRQKELIRWYVATEISPEMLERIGVYELLQGEDGEVHLHK